LILPDLNLLVYAHNSSSRHHEAAYAWMKDLFVGPETVGIPWAVVLGFIRLLSNGKVTGNPMDPAQLTADVRTWLDFPGVRMVTPGVRHLGIVRELFSSSGCSGRLTTDVHLAALAIELDAVLHSNDADFGRFPGLTWVNPLG